MKNDLAMCYGKSNMDDLHNEVNLDIYQDTTAGGMRYRPGWRYRHPYDVLIWDWPSPLWCHDVDCEEEGPRLSFMRSLGRCTRGRGWSAPHLWIIFNDLYRRRRRDAFNAHIRAAFVFIDGALETSSIGGCTAARNALQLIEPWLPKSYNETLESPIELPSAPGLLIESLTDESMDSSALSEWRLEHVPLFLALMKSFENAPVTLGPEFGLRDYRQ